MKINELKAKALPVWIKLLSLLGIKSAKSALEKRLPNGSPEQELVLGVAEPLVGTIEDLSDTNPNNSVQVRSRWLKWLNTFMTPWLFRLFQPVVDKIKLDYNKKMVQYIKDLLERIGLVLTDEIKPDNDQIDSIIDKEVGKESTKNLVIYEFAGGNLSQAGLDDDLIAFFQEAASIGWDAITGKTNVQAHGVSTQEFDGHKVITLPSGRTATFFKVAA